MTDTTILPRVRTTTRQTGRVYYYRGNFFMPLNMVGGDFNVAKREIKRFMKTNRERVKADRERLDYQSLRELAA